MEQILEIIKANWFELLSAVATIVAIFITRGKAGKHLTIKEAELKVKKYEKKLDKDLANAKKDGNKLNVARKELENARNSQKTE